MRNQVEDVPVLGGKVTSLPLLNAAFRSAKGTGDLFINYTLSNATNTTEMNGNAAGPNDFNQPGEESESRPGANGAIPTEV